MRRHRFLALSIVLVTLALAALACDTGNVVSTQTPSWTPPPVSTAGEVAVPTELPVPTLAPIMPAATEAPAGQAAGPQPTAADAPAVPAATVKAGAPSGSQTVVITDADLQKAIAAGVANGSGLEATNLQIHFTGGKVRMTADNISYGIVQANNLQYVGHLTAQDGVLQVQEESVSPGGIIGALIPTVVNQALRQYASQWYVEQVHTSEGQIELTVR